jgi:lipopolysaccharide export system permease protein
MLRSLVFRDAEELIYTILRRQGALQYSGSPYVVYVKGVQGRKLINPIFKHIGPDGIPDMVSHSKEADLRVNITKKVLYLHMRWGEAASENGDNGYFENRVWEVPMGENFGKPGVKRQREMIWEELISTRDEVQQKIEELDHDIEAAKALLEADPDADPTLPTHIQNLTNNRNRARAEKINLEIEMLMRVSLSLGCLCFILIGCPVGIWFSRSDFLSSFITSFLPIVIVYYPLMLCGAGLAREGKLNAIFLVFLCNIVVGVTGIFMTWRLTRS